MTGGAGVDATLLVGEYSINISYEFQGGKEK